MAKPAKPTVPPPPLRSNPETFSARMEASLLFWKTFADYLDALGDHAETQADAALAAALAAGAGTGLALRGNGGKLMAVNAGATALEFLTASGAGKAILANASAAGLALASDADAAAQRATLGLGTVTPLAEAVTDLSAITRSGWNRFAAAQTANTPFATGAGMVLTIFYDGSAAVQLVWGHNKGESDTGQWIRWRAASAWGGWVRLHGSQVEINGLIGALALGVAQSWQDVTAARLAGTNYQNTTGRPIAVSITTSGTTANTALYLGVAAPANILIAATGTGSTLRIMSHQAVVPAGHYYRFEGAAPATWAELR
ncbi:pyocin knob domain-containing protein [Rhodobacter capsulatus]|uniref:pyocin knob domain-containing protein n=1 Tax=Rhodobacter capsulatus TaxID=1061 RepID=UPI0003D3712D|nr:pyocin knob domain-containing protein [Rhodobacter capsulatus]ETD86377.1 hypothetical protein U703_00285 [Rhodobacter capsulatus YW1]